MTPALPEAIELMREVGSWLERLDCLTDEAQVRAEALAINRRIEAVNARVTRGPATSLASIPVENLVRRWRAAREKLRGE